MEVGRIDNRIPFLLLAGQRLRAVSDLSLYVPAAILDPPGTPISELIVLSNEDSEIGLEEAPGAPGKVSMIIVNMRVGDEVYLGRTAEVAVDGLKPNAIAFEALNKVN